MSAALGEFEQIVLLAILRLQNGAYGVPIRQEIMNCTGRSPAPGALYTVLERLERKGMVVSQMGDSTAERGGKPKRYYNVTRKGLSAVARTQGAYQRLLKGLSISEVGDA
jgi:PadR family transcriptional regulator, regulatory protein PadR